MADRSKALTLTPELADVVRSAQRKFSTIAKKSGGLVNWSTEANFAMQAIARSERLQKCLPQSIIDAMTNVAAIGLSLNPQQKHMALVPRYDSKLSALVCCADPMFQGLIAIGTESEAISGIRAEVVREADIRDGHFHYEAGTTPSVTFNPSPFMSIEDRGPIKGAFAIAQIPGAHPHVTFMRIEELHAIRDNYSESWKWKLKVEGEAKAKGKTAYQYGGPWEDSEEEMCKKTVIKRSAKTWPRRDRRVAAAIAASDYAEGNVIERRATDIEADAVELITKTQLDDLTLLLAESHVDPKKVLNRFKIEKLEELPRNEFERCCVLLKESKLIYVLRHATPETEIYAEDWGITYEALEGKAADQSSVAKLFSKRTAP